MATPFIYVSGDLNSAAKNSSILITHSFAFGWSVHLECWSKGLEKKES